MDFTEEEAWVSHLLSEQYDLIRKTRETLFSFLESLPADVLHKKVPGFGFDTIAHAHLHAAGCYMHWLVKFARIRSYPQFPTDEEIQSADVPDLRHWFSISDAVVAEFLSVYESRLSEVIYHHSEGSMGVTPLWLMTHTITHEFHHKGQIVAMARCLGYAPPDTDLVVAEGTSE